MSVQRVNFTSSLLDKSNIPNPKPEENVKQETVEEKPVEEKISEEASEVSEVQEANHKVRNWSIGLSAAAVLIGLGVFAGRKGHLGEGVQKFLRGVKSETEHAAGDTAGHSKPRVRTTEEEITIEEFEQATGRKLKPEEPVTEEVAPVVEKETNISQKAAEVSDSRVAYVGENGVKSPIPKDEIIELPKVLETDSQELLKMGKLEKDSALGVNTLKLENVEGLYDRVYYFKKDSPDIDYVMDYIPGELSPFRRIQFNEKGEPRSIFDGTSSFAGARVNHLTTPSMKAEKEAAKKTSEVIPVPKAEETPLPKTEEKPVVKAEEASAPKVAEESIVKTEETPVPKAEEKPIAKAEEAPAPKVEEPIIKTEEAPAPKAEIKAEEPYEQRIQILTPKQEDLNARLNRVPPHIDMEFLHHDFPNPERLYQHLGIDMKEIEKVDISKYKISRDKKQIMYEMKLSNGNSLNIWRDNNGLKEINSIFVYDANNNDIGRMLRHTDKTKLYYGDTSIKFNYDNSSIEYNYKKGTVKNSIEYEYQNGNKYIYDREGNLTKLIEPPNKDEKIYRRIFIKDGKIHDITYADVNTHKFQKWDEFDENGNIIKEVFNQELVWQ